MDASELDLNLDKDVTVDWVADASIASLPSRSVFLSRSSLTESQTGYWGLFGGALGSQQLLTMDVRLPSSAGIAFSRFGQRTTLLSEYLVLHNIFINCYTPSVFPILCSPECTVPNSFTHYHIWTAIPGGAAKALGWATTERIIDVAPLD